MIDPLSSQELTEMLLRTKRLLGEEEYRLDLTKTDLATHQADTTNPHAVTAAQAEAIPETDKDTFAKRQGYSASIAAAGWYRIAKNGPVASGGTGGNRAHALFTVRDTRSSYHSAVTFYASVHYGANPTLTVLNRSWYGSDGAITKIRLIEGATYEGAAVEVYVQIDAKVNFTIYDNEHSTGWVPVNWEAGSIPTDFVTTQLDLDTCDPVIAIAANGIDNTFYIKRNGDAYVQGKLLTRAQAGGQNIWVQDTEPTAIATGDIWIDTA